MPRCGRRSGWKPLVPGCAGRETAHQTHFRIFRTDGPGKHPMARAGILAGNPVHEEGCARYAKHFRVRTAKRYPLVIASAGGFPKDINRIQSHKALDNAFLATHPGGMLILLTECPGGVTPLNPD